MAKIEFIEYTGCYPCLCMGDLYVKIDGITTHFGDNECWDEEGNPNKTDSYGFPTYPQFWSSGGGISFDDEYMEQIRRDPWELRLIDVDEFPDDIKRLLPELIRIFNENVKWGCCGGCV